MRGRGISQSRFSTGSPPPAPSTPGLGSSPRPNKRTDGLWRSVRGPLPGSGPGFRRQHYTDRHRTSENRRPSLQNSTMVPAIGVKGTDQHAMQPASITRARHTTAHRRQHRVRWEKDSGCHGDDRGQRGRRTGHGVGVSDLVEKRGAEVGARSLARGGVSATHVQQSYIRTCGDWNDAEIGTTERRVERGLLEAARYCGVGDQDLPATRSVVVTIIMRYTVLVPGFAWATWAKTDLK